MQAQDAEAVQHGDAAARKLAAARAELDGLQEVSGTLGAAVNEAKRVEQKRADLAAVAKPEVDGAALGARRDALAKDIAKARRTAGDRPRSAAELNGDAAHLEAEKASLDRECAATAPKISRLQAVKKPEASVEELEKALTTQSERRDALAKDIGKREKTTEETAAGIAGLESDKRARAVDYIAAKAEFAALDAERKKFASHDRCPTCLAAGTEWQSVWFAAHDAKIALAHVKLDTATVEGTRLKSSIAAATIALASMRDQDAALSLATQQAQATERLLAAAKSTEAEWLRSQSEIQDALGSYAKAKDASDALAPRIATAQAEYSAAKRQDDALAALQAEHDEAVETLKGAQAALDAYAQAQRELAALPPVDRGAASARLEAHQSVVKAKRLEISGLEAQADEVVRQRAELKRQMEAATAATAAQAGVDVLKFVRKLLDGKQEQLVATAFRSLLETANKFSEPVIGQPLEYKDGEVGYYAKDGGWVSSSVFSGAEELVTFVGLCVALAATTPEKVVLLDECTRLVGPTKVAVLTRLADLVERSVIAQAVLVDGTDAEQAYGFAAAAMASRVGISIVKV